MEDLSQSQTPTPPKKKKGLTENQKSWLTFGAIAAIGLFGGLYMLLLPTQQETAAKKLAGEIKALEGNGYQTKVNNMMKEQLKGFATDEAFNQGFVDALEKMDSSLTFSGLREFEDGEYGAVEIKDAQLSTTFADDLTTKQIGTYSNFIVKQKPDNPNKYFYSTDGENKEMLVSNGKEQAALITKYTGAVGNFELGTDGQFKSMESNVKQLSYTDGSGTMTYVTLNNVSASFSRNSTPEKTDLQFAFNADEIDAGSTLKMMLGDLKPLNLKLDFAYSGDPIEKLKRIADTHPDLQKNLQQDPAKLLAEMGTAEKYSGQIKLNNFALMSGDMGFATNADLTFTAFPYQPMPKGNFTFTIKNYPALIAYARNFVPLEQEQVDSELFAAKEYLSDDGTNLTLSATFDGTRKIKLGTGKEIDVLDEYTSATAPAPAATPEAPESQFEKEVSSSATPAPLEKIQQRELNK